jgi:hypothetical protein
MLRYYMHMRNGSEFMEDYEGSDHPDIAAVHQEAVDAAREIMADQVRAGRMLGRGKFLIFDEGGGELALIPFRAALRLG